MIAVPIAAKNRTATAATKVTKIAKTNIPITDFKFIVSTVRLSLVYFFNHVPIITISIIAHTKCSMPFLFITFSTFYARFISQHIDSHSLIFVLVPDFTHGIFTQVSHWMKVLRQTTRIYSAIRKSMHVHPWQHAKSLAVC